MAIKLVCTLPFHGYAKGQQLTDQHLVAALLDARDVHFVKVETPDAPDGPAPAAEPEPMAAEHSGE
jgi:hypothetical protein